jgi:hypothetical protein
MVRLEFKGTNQQARNETELCEGSEGAPAAEPAFNLEGDLSSSSLLSLSLSEGDLLCVWGDDAPARQALHVQPRERVRKPREATTTTRTSTSTDYSTTTMSKLEDGRRKLKDGRVMDETEWQAIFGPVFADDRTTELTGVPAFLKRFAGYGGGQLLWEQFGKYYILEWSATVMMFSKDRARQLTDRHRFNLREQVSVEDQYVKTVLKGGVQLQGRGAVLAELISREGPDGEVEVYSKFLSGGTLMRAIVKAMLNPANSESIYIQTLFERGVSPVISVTPDLPEDAGIWAK